MLIRNAFRCSCRAPLTAELRERRRAVPPSRNRRRSRPGWTCCCVRRRRGDVAGHRDPVQLAGLAVVVVRGVVLGDAVVEEHQLVRLPVDADHVLGAGDVGLEQPQDVLGFGVGQSHDPQPLGEAADEEAALPGQRVDPDHGVGSLELDPGEFLPPLTRRWRARGFSARSSRNHWCGWPTGCRRSSAAPPAGPA